MKLFTSKTQKIGAYGEDICVRWLNNNGFRIIERNYTRPVGEIDIIALKDNTLHFIEVKSVSCENTDTISHQAVYNPAENVTREKIHKCYKTIATYQKEHNVSYETQFDVYLVYIDQRNIKHKIERIENVF
ncbi:YraN family protein [Patescibacteria group bacterium]|nr:YraN family protein [Patescibacteria group bacterium]